MVSCDASTYSYRAAVMVGGNGVGRGVYETYTTINNALIPRIIVDVDGDAAEGGYFRGELGEAGVVLSAWGEKKD